jgi:hypothetical protein
MESLRKDIASYSDKLRLNPKSNSPNGGGGKKKSKLTQALSGME